MCAISRQDQGLCISYKHAYLDLVVALILVVTHVFLVNIVACSQEEEFRSGATLQVVEALIHINNKLQQKEAAEGLLERVMAQREAGDANLKVILTTKYSQLYMK